MRLRPVLSRTRATALATGVAAAAVLTVGTPVSATAQADVTATLRVPVTVTVTDGDSVMTQTAGQWVQVFSSHGCYDAIKISGTYVETDGQVISFTL